MRRWLFVLVLLVLAAPAHAHSRHHHVYHHHHRGKLIVAPDFAVGLGKGLEHMLDSIGPRPHAWCGWEMRQLVGSDPGPEYNLAINWSHWGHPSFGPVPGAIGVERHHVFKVISVIGDGKVMAISGNDGHAVRVRERSTSRVIAWRVE